MGLENTFVLLVGASGSGKSTIAKILEFRGYRVLQSYTTRPRRYEGEEGHIFVDSSYLVPMSEMVACTKFDGHAYWATHEQVEQSDLYIIDPLGVEFFSTLYEGNKLPVVVYIDIPAWTRFRRMLKRGDGFISALRRIIHDYKAFKDVEWKIKIKGKKSDSMSIAIGIDKEMQQIEEALSEGYII